MIRKNEIEHTGSTARGPNSTRVLGSFLRCTVCSAGNLAEYSTQISVHFIGFKNLARPAILVFPKILVCLNCGFSRLTIPEGELRVLREGTAATATP
jgi:hypothetical protein